MVKRQQKYKWRDREKRFSTFSYQRLLEDEILLSMKQGPVFPKMYQMNKSNGLKKFIV